MTKLLIIFLLVSAVLFAPSGNVAHAQDAANYTWEFSSTNFYGDDGVLEYYFSGLDDTADYIWMLQGIDENRNPTAALGTIRWDGGGVDTTVQVDWVGNDGDFDRGNGTLFSGPARVIDNFGNELGTHFIAPGCSQNFEWECGEVYCWIDTCTATNGPTARIIVGDRANMNPENADNYFHDYNNPNVVLTLEGEYTLLHYRAPNGYSGSDEYRFHSIDDPTVTHTFLIGELIAYNTDKNISVLSDWFAEQSFVVLNTSGEQLPFINQVQNNHAFTAGSVGDNPHLATFGVGAYDYTRNTTGGSFVADGESVFLVSAEHGWEWYLDTGQNTITAGSIMVVELESTTPEIWDVGYTDHLLEDSEIGVLDTDDYIFLNRRTDNFTVSAVPVDPVFITWTITPTATNSGVKSFAESRFEIVLEYIVQGALGVDQRFEESLAAFGMDTPFGRMVGLLAIMGSVMVFVAVKGVRGFVPFALIYVTIGGGWFALGLGDSLSLLIFGISAIVLLYMMVGQSSTANDSGM